MKILKINRYDWERNLGGDVIQMKSIGACLESMGHEVRHATGYKQIQENLPWCDLAHIYNVQRSSEAAFQVDLCKKHSKKIVISPIIADFSTLNNQGRHGIRKIIESSLKNHSNIIKDVARISKGVQEINTLPYSLRRSHLENLKYISARCDIALPNSEAEASYLIKDLGFNKEKIKIIKNGVSEDLLQEHFDKEILKKHAVHWEKFALCVARIDERKNILNLVKALKDTNINLLIIGTAAPLHKSYLNEVLGEIKSSSNIIHINKSFSQKELTSIYRLSHLHVLPSWLETPGLVSLEAGLFGNNLVVGDCPPVREYFNGFANFCTPHDINSIREETTSAYTQERSSQNASEIIREKYSWRKISEKYLETYRQLLEC